MSALEKCIGFYRENNAIQGIYSKKNTFYDDSLEARHKAVIVPLHCYQNDRAWTVSSYYSCLDLSTKSLLDRNIVWVTSGTESSPFYALMYIDASGLLVTRTGYLLLKVDNAYKPVVIGIEGVEYLVEMKGCGCPSGGFLEVHQHSEQVGGGLGLEEGQNEFEQLSATDKLFKDQGLSGAVKPLAVTQFDYLNKSFSVLLRLVPSSLRASFGQHEAFDSLLDKRQEQGYFHMGKRAACLLTAPRPLVHQSLNLNNMVYVSPDNYELTDGSALTVFSETHETLDYIKLLFPVSFMNEQLKWPNLNEFLRGYYDFKQDGFEGVKCLSEALQIHEKLLASQGLQYYRDMCQSGQDFSTIQTNLTAMRTFFGQDFFSLDKVVWLKRHLIPVLESSLEVLTYLLDLRQSLTLSLFRDVLTFDTKLDQVRPYVEQVFLLAPFLNTQTRHNGDLRFLDQFVFGIEKKSTHKGEIKRVNGLYQQALSIVESGTWGMFSVEDFLLFKVSPNKKTMSYLLFPHVFLGMAVLETERQILQGCLDDENIRDDEKLHVEAILTQHQQGLQQLMADPDLYRKMLGDDDVGFLQLFKWPIP